jgi:hypothetical protein
MKASEFLAHLTERGVRCVVRGDRFVAKGASILPVWTKQALTAHREELRRYLVDGVDQDLKPTAARRELVRLGFIQLETGVFCHPQGDHKGDLVLLGLIDPEELAAENAQAARDINAPPAPPPRAVPVKDLREIYPGRFRWSEDEGVLYKDPFPRLRSRITEY